MSTEEIMEEVKRLPLEGQRKVAASSRQLVRERYDSLVREMVEAHQTGDMEWADAIEAELTSMFYREGDGDITTESNNEP